MNPDRDEEDTRVLSITAAPVTTMRRHFETEDETMQRMIKAMDPFQGVES